MTLNAANSSTNNCGKLEHNVGLTQLQHNVVPQPSTGARTWAGVVHAKADKRILGHLVIFCGNDLIRPLHRWVRSAKECAGVGVDLKRASHALGVQGAGQQARIQVLDRGGAQAIAGQWLVLCEEAEPCLEAT